MRHLRNPNQGVKLPWGKLGEPTGFSLLMGARCGTCAFTLRPRQRYRAEHTFGVRHLSNGPELVLETHHIDMAAGRFGTRLNGTYALYSKIETGTG